MVYFDRVVSDAMFRAGVGHSLETDTAKAAREAARRAMSRAGISRAHFVLLFSSASHIPFYGDLFREIRGIVGTDRVTGCSAMGIITTDCEVEQGSVLAAMVFASDDVEFRPFLEASLAGREVMIGKRIGNRVARADTGHPIIALFPDPLALDAEALFGGIESAAPGVDLIGGAASEELGAGRTYQFAGDRVVSGGVSGFAVVGSFHHSIGISQACHAVGEPRIVTRVEENTIVEIGGRLALDVLEEFFAEPAPQQRAAASGPVLVAFPADPSQSAIIRGEYLVRHIVGIDRNRRTVTIQEPVRAGQAITFALRDKDRSKSDMTEMLGEQVRVHAGHSPRIGLYFNCCERGSSLYGKSSVDRDLIAARFGDLPLIGFSSVAEIAPVHGVNLLHNYSGTMVLISDGPPRARAGSDQRSVSAS